MKIKGNDKIQLNKTRILLSVLDHFVWSLFGSVYISISFLVSFRFVSFGTLFTLDYLVVVALVVFIYYFILWFLFTFYGVSLFVPEQLKYQFASFINLKRISFAKCLLPLCLCKKEHVKWNL